jgi:hypothetical protein
MHLEWERIMGLITRVMVVAVAGLSILPAGAFSIRSANDRDAATVTYCDLIRNPERYKGKLVRVSAIYRYGYEWSELYCLECMNEGRTWVEFDETFVSSTKASIRKKIGENGFKGRTVRVVMVGRFDSGGAYGHMGAYRFGLLVDRLEKADVILNDSPSPNALPKAVLSRIHCPSSKSR